MSLFINAALRSLNLYLLMVAKTTESIIFYITFSKILRFLEKPYNCLYPFLVRCVVIGIVTPDQLITKIHPQELPFSYSRPDHKNFYEDLILNIHEKYFNDYVRLE